MNATEETTKAYALGLPADSDIIASITADQVIYVPTAMVSVEKGFNARDFTTPENKDHVARLAKLIGANGVENPARVRIDGDRIVLTDGESRLRATLSLNGSAKGTSFPVLLDPDGDDETRRIESLVVKNSGRSLTMLETLSVVSRLEARGLKAKDIQDSLGFTRTHYGNLKLLGKAPEIVLEYVREGRVSATLVVDLVREYKDDPETVAKSIISAVKKAEREVANASAADAKKKATKRDVEDEDGVTYSKGNMDGLIFAMKEAFHLALPASEHRAIRATLRRALENVGSDTTPNPGEEEIVEETEE